MSETCNLPGCDVKLVHTKGRRKKKYCTPNHAVQHWQQLHPEFKEKKKKPFKIEKEEWLKIQDTVQKLEAHLNSNGRENKFENAARGRDEDGGNSDEVKSGIQIRIDEIRETLKISPRFLPDRKRKPLETELKELEAQLK